MRLNIKILLLVIISLGTSCNEEDKVIVSDIPELIYGKYTLPQGDHEFDDEIVKFYADYHSLLLYKFSKKDFEWNVTGSILWNPVSDTTGGGYEYEVADEMYVGAQLDLLHNKCFNYFPKEWLKALLPQRILLCSKLNRVGENLSHYPTEADKYFQHGVQGYCHFAVNWGNADILSMTAEDRNTFKIEMCKLFLRYIFPSTGNGEDRLKRPKLFETISSYTDDYESGNYTNGILDPNHRTSVREDWFDYLIMVISTPYSELISEGGMLSPAVDIEGKIRKKYDILVNYFLEEHGFDIQQIGNDVEI